MVLAASIVGSGELIATTTLGAEVGFLALWIIVVSCAIKPVVQGELGRYTIATGETALEAFARVPGPRIPGTGGRVNWLVACWLLTVLLSLLQVGGMFGGVALVLNLLVPAVSANIWVGICLALTLALLLGGGYSRIEKLAVIKVSFFTVLTVCAAAVLLATPGAVSGQDLVQGFALPAAQGRPRRRHRSLRHHRRRRHRAGAYPYWCIEKGYARYTGPRDGSAEWLRRARGWIRVMHLDIACSLVIYTLATLAFYLLGAGVLHRIGLVPKGTDMIVTLSRLYTDTLGGWALWFFFAGAVITLYGTIFASTAAHARVTADLGAHGRRLRSRRWRGARPLARHQHRDPGDAAGGVLLDDRIAGANGGGGRAGPGADAAAHRPGGHLPPAQGRAEGSAAGAAHDRDAVAVGDRDGGGGDLLRRLAAALTARTPRHAAGRSTAGWSRASSRRRRSPGRRWMASSSDGSMQAVGEAVHEGEVAGLEQEFEGADVAELLLDRSVFVIVDPRRPVGQLARELRPPPLRAASARCRPCASPAA